MTKTPAIGSPTPPSPRTRGEGRGRGLSSEDASTRGPLTLTLSPSTGRGDEIEDLSRRTFLQVLGGGIVIVVAAEMSDGQQNAPEQNRGTPGGGEQPRGNRGRGGRQQQQQIPVAARVRIDKDGTITVMTGKVECGQGSRAELTQAAAEELRVSPERVHLLMADTSSVPDDGITAGSRTTPSTVPAVRAGAAA